MTEATKTILRAALAADVTVADDERADWMRALDVGMGAFRREAAATAAATATRAAVVPCRKAAALLNRTVQTLRKWELAGVLEAVRRPGAKRAVGYTHESVQRLLRDLGRAAS